MSNESNKVVFCVMVSFNPSMEGLKDSVTSVLANKVKLVLVDNGSNNQQAIADFVAPYTDIALIALEKNVGIASAQNRGIKYALDQGADFIWLSDQDSVYSLDFIELMLAAIQTLDQISRKKLAVIGPSFFDTNRGNLQPVVRLSPFFKEFEVLGGLNAASHIIASGMIIPKDIFHKIGFKNEALFIDWVDTEWCWRAINAGFIVLVNGGVTINHTLGDSFVIVMNKKIIIRSSFRHYFMIRNELALALYFKGIPFGARLEMVGRTIIRLILIPMIAPRDKFSYVKAGLKGFFHGLKNELNFIYKQ